MVARHRNVNDIDVSRGKQDRHLGHGRARYDCCRQWRKVQACQTSIKSSTHFKAYASTTYCASHFSLAKPDRHRAEMTQQKLPIEACRANDDITLTDGQCLDDKSEVVLVCGNGRHFKRDVCDTLGVSVPMSKAMQKTHSIIDCDCTSPHAPQRTSLRQKLNVH